MENSKVVYISGEVDFRKVVTDAYDRVGSDEPAFTIYNPEGDHLHLHVIEEQRESYDEDEDDDDWRSGEYLLVGFANDFSESWLEYVDGINIDFYYKETEQLEAINFMGLTKPIDQAHSLTVMGYPYSWKPWEQRGYKLSYYRPQAKKRAIGKYIIQVK